MSARPVDERSGSVSDRPADLPTFLIVGAMRSGTTSLTRYLRSHPDVFISDQKELHFFDFNFDEGAVWYRSKFAGGADRAALGEATPNYMYIAESMPRIAKLVPGARLIVILRNPVDRAYSHYWHNRAVGRESLEFDDALAAEPARIASEDPHERAYWSYVDRGRYLGQLERICGLFPREALHVALFDDLRDGPEDSYRSVCRFLGLDEGHRPPELGEAVNGFVEFRSRRLRSLTRRLPKSATRLIGRVNARPASYPPMRPETRSRLLDGFAEGNAALGAWLGRDLDAWRG